MTADTPARCEPPPELRGVDGWHWVDADRPIACMWQWDPWSDTGAWKMPGSTIWGPDSAYRHGYRYLAPVTPPAEVEALRADADEWKRLCTIAEPDVAALRAELNRCETACFDVQANNIALRAEAARITAERDAGAWQPIATAPRDGTMIDLWFEGVFQKRMCDFAWRGEFWASDYRGVAYNDDTNIITAWRPIPPGPADG